MRAEGTVLAPISLGRTWTSYVNVLRGIVDMQRVANTEHALVCSSSPNQEQIDFLQHLRVTPDHGSATRCSRSKVRVELSEYSLHISGERRRHQSLPQAARRPGTRRVAAIQAQQGRKLRGREACPRWRRPAVAGAPPDRSAVLADERAVAARTSQGPARPPVAGGYAHCPGRPRVRDPVSPARARRPVGRPRDHR